MLEFLLEWWIPLIGFVVLVAGGVAIFWAPSWKWTKDRSEATRKLIHTLGASLVAASVVLMMVEPVVQFVQQKTIEATLISFQEKNEHDLLGFGKRLDDSIQGLEKTLEESDKGLAKSVKQMEAALKTLNQALDDSEIRVEQALSGFYERLDELAAKIDNQISQLLEKSVAKMVEAHMQAAMHPEIVAVIQKYLFARPLMYKNYNTTLSLGERGECVGGTLYNDFFVLNNSHVEQLYKFAVDFYAIKPPCGSNKLVEVRVKWVDDPRAKDIVRREGDKGLQSDNTPGRQRYWSSEEAGRESLNIMLRPREKIRVQKTYAISLGKSDNFETTLRYPTVGMGVEVFLPDGVVVEGVTFEHPAALESVPNAKQTISVSPTYDTTKACVQHAKADIQGGILPFQSIDVYWCPAQDLMECRLQSLKVAP